MARIPAVSASAGSTHLGAPGCSTGEEVYSLAISLLEFLGDKAGRMPIKIFGTDISEPAIDKARAGKYLANIAAQVSPERLRTFFVSVDGESQPAPISDHAGSASLKRWCKAIELPPRAEFAHGIARNAHSLLLDDRTALSGLQKKSSRAESL